MVHRRRLVGSATAAVAAGAAGALPMPAIAQSTPQIKWRMASSFPKSLDTLYGSAELFCKTVADLTDGKFQIQLFAAGEIVPGLQVLDAVQNNTVECGQTPTYYYFGKNPAFTFGTALPFGLNARMMNAWFYHGGGNELINEFLAKFNVYGIPAGNTNCQMGGWFRKEIKSLADLQGLKFRVGGFAGRILQRLGVVPQQLAAGDIYPALEKGTIDAAEWVGPYDDEKLGFYKVARYYYYPGWWEAGPCPHMIFNLAKWNELPKLYKDACHTAAAQTNLWMSAKYDHLNPAALRRLVAGGAQLRPFPAEVMEACFNAAKEVYAEISKENADFKKLHDSVVAYRGEQYLWWQVAEYTYDTYMIRLRAKG